MSSEFLKELGKVYKSAERPRDVFGRRPATLEDFGRTPATPAQIQRHISGDLTEADYPPTAQDVQIKDDGDVPRGTKR